MAMASFIGLPNPPSTARLTAAKASGPAAASSEHSDRVAARKSERRAPISLDLLRGAESRCCE